MSIDKSLRLGSSLARPRNVYTRAERVEILMKEGRLAEGENVIGLPKVRVVKRVKKGKKKKKEEGEEG